ncbi:uncharacterized protein VTP21DRAFT_6098 [Calcarisporiella thermophila]|uniref:uncharacterized protein n=1 Tax=Calcarisporiella thermophila TaxID=911321 RepID=UPI003741EDF7
MMANGDANSSFSFNANQYKFDRGFHDAFSAGVDPAPSTKRPLTAEAIESAVRAMDTRYRTTFAQWVRSPANLSCTGERLRRLIASRKPAVPDVARVVRWITDAWEPAPRQHLVRLITYGWEVDRRRLLEFWIMRLERGFEEINKRKRKRGAPMPSAPAPLLPVAVSNAPPSPRSSSDLDMITPAGNPASASLAASDTLSSSAPSPTSPSSSSTVAVAVAVTAPSTPTTTSSDQLSLMEQSGTLSQEFNEWREEDVMMGGREEEDADERTGKRARLEQPTGDSSTPDRFGMNGGSGGFAL